MPLDASLLNQSAPDRVVHNVRIDAVPSAVEVESDGARLLNASSSDLLGLAVDARVREAFQAALRKYGLGRAGRSHAQDELEERLAGLLGVPAVAVLEDAGPAFTCLRVAGALVEARTAHLLQGAPAIASPEAAERSGPGALVVSAVDVHSGDLTPLHRYAETTQRAGLSLVAVDPVGLGVLGPQGLGAVESLGLSDHVGLQLFFLGAALPGVGVVIAGGRAEVQALRRCGPPPPAAAMVATSKALQLATAEAPRRVRTFDVAHVLLERLREQLFDTGPCVTPWIPVWMGDETLTEQWLRGLADAGVACRALLAGPHSRLLLSMAATATDAQVDQVLGAFGKVARKLEPPRLEAAWKGPVLLARPGSFALATPCAPHWRPSAQPPLGVVSTPEYASPAVHGLRERLFDAVETLTWRATNLRGAKVPGGDALKALLDRRRKR